MKRIVFCWSHISGYMAACWRELASRAGVQLRIIAFSHNASNNIAFDAAGLMKGVDHTLLGERERRDYTAVRELVGSGSPDAIFVGGWSHEPYVRLAFRRELAQVRFVMMMDNPRRNDLRQALARLKIGRYVDRMDRVIVSGERAWQFARQLKVPECKIRRGMYGIDFRRLDGMWARRMELSRGWPKEFLFVGRYEEVKGLDVLVEAYSAYRQQVAEPWPLHCCGMGPLKSRLVGVSGITDHGFLQPDSVLDLQSRCGAFVLPSRFDHWPLAIVENCSAGLPIVCTEACGSAVENVRSFFNGLTVTSGNVAELTQALHWIHEHHDLLPEMGKRSRGFGAAYSAERWADRIQAVVQ